MDKETESMDGSISYTKYIYEDAEYYFYYDMLSSAQHPISYITVNKASDFEGPRGLQVGDTLEEVLAQYPGNGIN